MRIAPVNPETQQTDTTRTISGINVLTREELDQVPFMDEGELEGDNVIFRRFFDVVISALYDPKTPEDSDTAQKALEILDDVVTREKQIKSPLTADGTHLVETYDLIYAEGSEEVILVVGVMPQINGPRKYFHGFIDLESPDKATVVEIEIRDGEASLSLST